MFKNIQYPVGQGGLHLGVVGKFAYIYDCGGWGATTNWNDTLKDVVDNIKGCMTLYLYISHFHGDHCNKLRDLFGKLPKGIDIKFYYPKPSTIQKIVLLAESNYNPNDDLYAQRSDEYYDLIFDTDKFINDEYVEKQKIKINPISIDPIRQKQSMEQVRRKGFDAIPVFEAAPARENFLLDAFVTLHNKTKIGHFKKMLKARGWHIDEDLLKDLKYNSRTLQEIRKIYRGSVGLIHGTMLCLYAGLRRHHEKHNWLHTGDMNLSYVQKRAFYRHYRRYLPYTNYIQIPHHGSNAYHTPDFNVLKENDHAVFFLTRQQSPSASSTRHVTPHLKFSYSPHELIEVEEALSSKIVT